MQPRAPTHEAVDFQHLWSLGEALAAAGPALSAADVDALAEAQGAERVHAWLALSYAPQVQVTREHDIALAVCAARCQLWGAGALLGELLELRDARLAAGKRAFDVVPRGCLNRCERAPVATAALADGLVGFDHCTRAQVEELLDALDAEG